MGICSVKRVAEKQFLIDTTQEAKEFLSLLTE